MSAYESALESVIARQQLPVKAVDAPNLTLDVPGFDLGDCLDRVGQFVKCRAEQRIRQREEGLKAVKILCEGTDQATGELQTAWNRFVRRLQDNVDRARDACIETSQVSQAGFDELVERILPSVDSELDHIVTVGIRKVRDFQVRLDEKLQFENQHRHDTLKKSLQQRNYPPKAVSRRKQVVEPAPLLFHVATPSIKSLLDARTSLRFSLQTRHTTELRG
ncbi:MAG: hypothetical protein KVP17_000939 [Porospora cf. gigantea B]|nr:MAG: hypothetical protein KVP17_000939 [Porospora cf. gigantea B]